LVPPIAMRSGGTCWWESPQDSGQIYEIDCPNGTRAGRTSSTAKLARLVPFVCTKLVYNGAMPTTKHVRRSVSLPTPIARQVERMAKSQRLSDNRILVELIELGIEARKQKEKAFFDLAERFRAESDPQQAKRLGDELGRLVFGE